MTATGVPLAEPREIGELANRLGGTLDRGVAERRVVRIVPPGHEGAQEDLVVVASARYVDGAARSQGVLLCDAALSPRVPAGRRWVHEAPWWVVATLVRVTPGSDPGAGGANVHSGARVHETARVATGAVVHDGVEVGEGSAIGEYAVLYSGVTVGRNVTVGAHTVLGAPGFGFGRGPSGSLLRIVHVGGVVIDDDVEIGPLCTVDAGTLTPTRIGCAARLDAHVHVAHNVQIGAGCFVSAQVGFAGSSVIGQACQIGGQAGFADHVRVGARARVAAKSGVIGDIPEGATVAGFPAVSRMRWLRAMATLLRRK